MSINERNIFKNPNWLVTKREEVEGGGTKDKSIQWQDRGSQVLHPTARPCLPSPSFFVC